MHLESGDVILIAIKTTQGLKGLHSGVSGGKNNAQIHQSPNFIGPIQAQSPRHQRAPIVPHHKHLLVWRRHFIDQRNQVSNHMYRREFPRILHRRTTCVGVPAEVRRHGPIPVPREEHHLVAPRVPAFGEAVEEEDYRALARFCYVHGKPVYAQYIVLNLFHLDMCEN